MLKPVLTLILTTSLMTTASAVQLFGDVEVSRLPTAEKTIGDVVTRYQALDDGLAQLSSKKNEVDATQLAARQGHRLWQ
ncbi:MAG: hypothetical protein KA770_06235, partial [Shewanella sp.]|nr:hypothetical protein [Shewanella sp.]